MNSIFSNSKPHPAVLKENLVILRQTDEKVNKMLTKINKTKEFFELIQQYKDVKNGTLETYLNNMKQEERI